MAAISERVQIRAREERSIVNWSTKTLAYFVAAAAPMGGKNNPLIKVAEKIDIEGGGDSRAGGRAEVPGENAPGSYERFMLGFARGGQR